MTDTNRFEELYKLKKEWIKEIVEITKPLNVNPYMYYHGALKALKYDEMVNAAAIRNKKRLIVAKDEEDFVKKVTKYFTSLPKRRVTYTGEIKNALRQGMEHGYKNMDLPRPIYTQNIEEATWLRDVLKKYCDSN